MKEYALIVAEGCHGCDEAKKRVEGDPRIKVLDVTKNDLASDIVAQLGIRAVPVIVEIDREKGKVCVIEGQTKKCAGLEVKT